MPEAYDSGTTFLESENIYQCLHNNYKFILYYDCSCQNILGFLMMLAKFALALGATNPRYVIDLCRYVSFILRI